MKLISPLFLDELKEEFRKIKGNKNKLKEFHKKLGTLKFLDPACGCGNFLIKVAQQWEVQVVGLAESLLGERIVDTDAIDSRTQTLIILEGIADRAHLGLARRSEGQRKEKEDDRSLGETIAQFYVDQSFVILAFELKIGCLRAFW